MIPSEGLDVVYKNKTTLTTMAGLLSPRFLQIFREVKERECKVRINKVNHANGSLSSLYRVLNDGILLQNEPLERHTHNSQSDQDLTSHLEKESKPSSNLRGSSPEDYPSLLHDQNEVDERSKLNQHPFEIIDWYVQVTQDGSALVQGICRNDPEKNICWDSCVVARLGFKKLCCESGQIFILIGCINSAACKNCGLSDSFVEAFKKGFPSSWKAFIKNESNKLLKESKNPRAVKTPNTIQKKTPVSQEASVPVRSSSGRIVFPALQWWKNERIIPSNGRQGAYVHPGSVQMNDFARTRKKAQNCASSAKVEQERKLFMAQIYAPEPVNYSDCQKEMSEIKLKACCTRKRRAAVSVENVIQDKRLKNKRLISDQAMTTKVADGSQLAKNKTKASIVMLTPLNLSKVKNESQDDAVSVCPITIDMLLHSVCPLTLNTLLNTSGRITRSRAKILGYQMQPLESLTRQEAFGEMVELKCEKDTCTKSVKQGESHNSKPLVSIRKGGSKLVPNNLPVSRKSESESTEKSSVSKKSGTAKGKSCKNDNQYHSLTVSEEKCKKVPTHTAAKERRKKDGPHGRNKDVEKKDVIPNQSVKDRQERNKNDACGVAVKLQITSKPGTLRHKQQLRAVVEAYSNSGEMDFMTDDAFRNKGVRKFIGSYFPDGKWESEDDDCFPCDINTPKNGIPTVKPVSDLKTPKNYGIPTPFLHMAKTKDVDRYLINRKKNLKKKAVHSSSKNKAIKIKTPKVMNKAGHSKHMQQFSIGHLMIPNEEDREDLVDDNSFIDDEEE